MRISSAAGEIFAEHSLAASRVGEVAAATGSIALLTTPILHRSSYIRSGWLGEESPATARWMRSLTSTERPLRSQNSSHNYWPSVSQTSAESIEGCARVGVLTGNGPQCERVGGHRTGPSGTNIVTAATALAGATTVAESTDKKYWRCRGCSSRQCCGAGRHRHVTDGMRNSGGPAPITNVSATMLAAVSCSCSR